MPELTLKVQTIPLKQIQMKLFKTMVTRDMNHLATLRRRFNQIKKLVLM
jgi:hypothetical protein